MRNLIILSERDISSSLTARGIKPSAFYTDYHKFKDMLPYFDNAVLVFIFASTCAFSKKAVCETIKICEKRKEDAKDTGIVDCLVFSDTMLPLCENYYKYEDRVETGVQYSRKKVKSKEVKDLWSLVEYGTCEDTKFVLSDMGYDVAKEDIQSKQIGTDAGLVSIKIPDTFPKV